ncbi:MAG TPA: protein kinase [Verrucomicrobiae bacterium]|nr:protein kinase [Verrucomicrobiae bacterium]
MAAPSQIAHYQITSKLGEGGMGAVYRAIDTKLHRDVAIKVLPPVFAADSSRMARFEREAQVLASLNHPNIAAIYGIEQGAIVMELVDGANLAGPLPIDTAIDYARQIAAGLEAAHEKGIVHRDLKPANIKITRGGQIKILDFGLAKASEAAPQPGNPSISPTLPLGMTEAGVILGTAAYMSPEQARGKPVDSRTDIWAFGAVLYELVTGRRLFEGEDLTETLAAVVKTDPDLRDVPEPIRRVLQRCLQKDPNKRLRHISSVELLLEKPAAPPEPVAHRARTAALSGLGALLFVAAAAGWWLYLRRPEPLKPELTRLEIVLPTDVHLSVFTPRISPDGRMVAFVASGGGDTRTRIWIRRLDSLDLRPLAGTEGANTNLFWLPGSRMLVYSSEGKLRKIDVTGGPPQAICDAGSMGGGFLTAGNKIVFGTRNKGILACPAEGGQAEPVLPLDAGGHEEWAGFPAPLPDGRRFLFWRQAGPESGIYAAALDVKPGEQRRTRVLPDPSAPWYVPGPNRHEGTLLFVRERTLMAQTLDPDTLQLKGTPVALGQNVSAPVFFSASDDGKVVYFADTRQRQLAWFDLEGKFLGNIGPPQDVLYAPAISSDGTRLAFSRDEPDDRSDIFVLDLARDSETRVTSGPAANEFPVWSPDGVQIAFMSTRNGPESLYARAADGSGSDRLLLKNGFPRAWAPDGTFLLLDHTSQGAGLWTLPAALNSEPKPSRYLQVVGLHNVAGFSPDGHYVAYVSNESGVDEVYVRPFASASPGASATGVGSVKVSLHGGLEAAWRADGKKIVYLTTGSPGKFKIWAVDVTLKPSFRADIPQPLGEIPAGERVFMPDLKRVLVEQPVGSQKPSIVVLSNWQAALPR